MQGHAANIVAVFSSANESNYAHQAKLFLNAFWAEMQSSAEKVYDFYDKWVQTDLHILGLPPTKVSSCNTELEAHSFHYFLEKHVQPLTAMQAREKLREADINTSNKVSFLEFLCWHFKKTPAAFADAVPEEIAGDANMSPALAAATKALNEARSEMQKIEDEKTRLQGEMKATGIKGMRAKAEYAQLLARDPTELNRALITAQAAVRKLGGSGNECPPATLWWMQRELEEMQKYKPSK